MTENDQSPESSGLGAFLLMACVLAMLVIGFGLGTRTALRHQAAENERLLAEESQAVAKPAQKVAAAKPAIKERADSLQEKDRPRDEVAREVAPRPRRADWITWTSPDQRIRLNAPVELKPRDRAGWEGTSSERRQTYRVRVEPTSVARARTAEECWLRWHPTAIILAKTPISVGTASGFDFEVEVDRRMIVRMVESAGHWVALSVAGERSLEAADSDVQTFFASLQITP